MKGLSSCLMWPSPAFATRLVVLIVLSGSWTALAPQAIGQGGRQIRSQGPPPVQLPASSQLTSPVQMQVAAVKPGTRAAAQAGASRIDQAVLNHLRQRGRRPQSAVSDSTFVRRIYLDLAGRIPSGDEVKAFLASPEPEKRLQLIDDLLASPDYVSNFYNMWADVLRLTERPEPNIIADPYLAYVKDAIRTNLAYDKWVYEMLTADGKIWDNPAVGYQLRDNGMPLPYVDNTVRIFLGTQIGCAQCHDHPFEDWSQRQFYELAAFTSGTLTRLGRNQFKDKKNPVPTLISQAQQQLSQQQVGPLQRLVRANTYAVQESNRKLKLPHDYAYADGKPNEAVAPQLPWGELPSGAAEASPRKQFAAWLTSADNERFSRTVANRLWQRLTGVGVVEPVDDFKDSNPPFSEELLTTLAEQLVEIDFDLAAPPTGKAKRVIYLFMDGAMSHLDTFDPKPSTSSQGETEPIGTTIAGIKFGNHFPRLAKLAGALAVVRSLSTETGAHEPGRYLMRTSYPAINSIRHPALGAWMLHAGFRGPKELPANILIGADNDHPMAGFLPPGLAPVPIGDPTKGLENAKKPGYLSERDFNHRMSLTNKFDRYFRQKYQGPEVQAYNQMYRDAIRLMGSEKLAAFNIKAESDAIRSAYGMNRFGQGCLLARRLIEEGVPCVEVNYGGWDMHNGLYEKLGELGPSLDQGLSALLTDLHTRGLLDSTLVVLATEFGRTPSINENAGRDHHPGAFSCVLAGAGIRTGQVYGASDEKGFGVADQPVSIADFNATVATALGLSTTTEYTAPNGRPFKIANNGQPVTELLA